MTLAYNWYAELVKLRVRLEWLEAKRETIDHQIEEIKDEIAILDPEKWETWNLIKSFFRELLKS